MSERRAAPSAGKAQGDGRRQRGVIGQSADARTVQIPAVDELPLVIRREERVVESVAGAGTAVPTVLDVVWVQGPERVD
ncbi:MAG: hypothetical protein ACT4NY_03000 [Pseudonocardiales bacterium]